MADVEKLVRRWLTNTETALLASPPDIGGAHTAFNTLKGHVEQLLEDSFPPLTLSARLWAKALHAQAAEDLLAAEVLAGGRAPGSVLCMLLQMVFEKLAKAALARVDEQCFIAVRMKHVAASRLVALLKANNDYIKLRHKWSDVLSFVTALERAHPAIARRGPHLEYPWEDDSRMALPKEHWIVRQFEDPRDPQGAKLLRFARELCDRFDELFP